MRILFRVDASLTIGSGHVVRCLTLADVLRERGVASEFVCRDLPGQLFAEIHKRGYPLHVLPKPLASATHPDWCPHASWLEVDWAQDVEDCQAIFSKELGFDWLVLDHYALDLRWEQAMRSCAGKIMVIDDLADRPHDCDLLLDQNLYLDQNRYSDLLPKFCKTLLGPHYALLRPEFGNCRKSLRKRNGGNKRLLVYFGGVDSTNETKKTLDAIKGILPPDVFVDVVVGVSNPHRKAIEQLCREIPQTSCYTHVEHMAELMASSDLMFGAGGTNTWERFCLGLPAVVVSVAKNQEDISSVCGSVGLHLYLGRANDVSIDDLAAALKTMLRAPTLLKTFSSNGLQRVDGQGATRVAQELIPMEIDLRLATPQDCEPIFAWRNSEETRRNIFNQEEISFADHQRWFVASLKNPDRFLLIGERNGIPVGVLRYDLQTQKALISVYLVPGGHLKGTGTALIEAGTEWLRRNYPSIQRIYAEIFPNNKASLRAFEKAGYTINYLTYCKELSP